MKRAALISLLALCAACRQQDPAVLISLSGPFLVPANADKLHLEVVVRYAKGPSGTILRQSVTPGLAAGPGLKIRLVVAR